MTRILVTGGSGFLAGYISDRLRLAGATRLFGSDIRDPGANRFDEFIETDIASEDGVHHLVERTRPDEVFHLAGIVSGDPLLAFRVNALGTVNLLSALRKHAPGAGVLVIGSAAEYGTAAEMSPPFTESDSCKPEGAYGASKHAATLAAATYARNCGMRVVIARLFNIVGAGVPESLVVGALARRAADAVREGRTSIRVGNLDARRDFLAVADAAGGCIAALRGGRPGEIYNLCSGEATPVGWIANRIVELSGSPLRLEVDPALDAGVTWSVGSYEKARRELGFNPSVPLDTAVREAWESVASTTRACA